MQMCVPQQQAEIIEVKFLTAGLEFQPPPSSCPVLPTWLSVGQNRTSSSLMMAFLTVAQADIYNSLQVCAEAIGCFYMMSKEVKSWLVAEDVSYRKMSMFCTGCSNCSNWSYSIPTSYPPSEFTPPLRVNIPTWPKPSYSLSTSSPNASRSGHPVKTEVSTSKIFSGSFQSAAWNNTVTNTTRMAECDVCQPPALCSQSCCL